MPIPEFVQYATQFGVPGVLCLWLVLERMDRKSAEAENSKLTREIVTLSVELKTLSTNMLNLLGKNQ